ncbi:MAG: hypothetical protein K2X03_12865 [Bryobacteraceae bacterium]|nr:hypothetical protein [Bryobacteraceae bacterium]
MGDNGALSAIRIIKPIANPDRAFHLLERQGTTLSLKQGLDDETFESVMSDFRQLESMLGFSGGISSIEWNSPTIALIPETDEEKSRVQVNNIYVRKFFEETPKRIPKSYLEKVVKSMEVYESLTVLQAFHREVQNEMRAHRFIHAFVNGFYILESLYANGKFGQDQVIAEFEKSPSLCQSAESLLAKKTFCEGEHQAGLQKALNYYQKKWGVRGLFYAIVATRGELHHYVATRNRRYGTPFRHDEYYTMALTVSYLESAGIAREIDRLKQAHQAKTALHPLRRGRLDEP